jgi:hypothetical protein
MIAHALCTILPSNSWVEVASTSNPVTQPVYAKETVREFLLRIKDELFWPRILVRIAPPPNEVQPIAPDRL